MHNIVHLGDCMEGMAGKPDNYYDLAVVDPPYGIGADWKKDSRGRKNRKLKGYDNNKIPDKKYFTELFRVSKNQIIWGWNYYTKYLSSTNYLIIWDKMRDVKKTFRSECEQAWTNIKIPQRIYHVRWDGCKKGKETGIITIHPHQKPILIYKLIFNDYAKPGWKILDTHVGSGSSRIPAYDMGLWYEGWEIDPDYHAAQEERYQLHVSKGGLFDTEEIQEIIYEQREI